MSDLNIKLNQDFALKAKKINNNATSPIMSRQVAFTGSGTDEFTSENTNNNKKKKGLFAKISAGIATAAAIAGTLASCFIPKTTTAPVDTTPAPIIQEVEQEGQVDDELSLYDQLRDHTHTATVIRSSHGTRTYNYIPAGGKATESNVVVQVEQGMTLGRLVDKYYSVNENDLYSVALDQAKANAKFVLDAINKKMGDEIYGDVADIPSDVLLNTVLNTEKESDNKLMVLVNSRHEDFSVSHEDDPLNMTTYVDNETFVSDNEFVVINPQWDGETPDPSGKPVYRTVEEAILANYRSTDEEKDNKLVESIWTDSYADIIDGIRDDALNSGIYENNFAGMSRDQANFMLKNTDFDERIELHFGKVTAQRITVGCSEHGAYENITNGQDYRFSYLDATVDVLDLTQRNKGKTVDVWTAKDGVHLEYEDGTEVLLKDGVQTEIKRGTGDYRFNTMYDVMAYYADPSDEAKGTGKSLLDRYNENPDDPETQAYILTATMAILENNKFPEDLEFEFDGEIVKASDLTAQQALQISLIDEETDKPIIDELELDDAAYNLKGEGGEEVNIEKELDKIGRASCRERVY